VAALAYAEVSTPTPAAAHVEAAPAAIDTASAAIDAASIEAVAPSSDEPTVNPDELLGDLRPQLSARGGRRTDESTLAAEQATPAPVQLEYAMTTSSGTLAAPAVKTATPQPVVKTPTKTPTPRPATTTSSALGQQVVSIAMRYIGYRYSYGGTSPSTGFDCSGFAYYVYKTAGHPISRDLGVQYNTGAWVSRSSLMPGDLVFFKNTWGYGLSHVAIYIGSGRFVHSRSEGYGVTTNSFDTYWSSHYLGARRP
jgi:cell wall-associated NlpC family hydrolase